MIPQYLMATGPSLNISLCQKIFCIYGCNRTIAKYCCVEKYFLSMVATVPLLNILLCQIYFLSMVATGPSLNILLCQKIFLSMVATGPSLNISLCQKIFFIYGSNQTIAKYIAASKKIFNNMAFVTLMALDSLMAILAAFNHRESERTSVCSISDSLRPIS